MILDEIVQRKQVEVAAAKARLPFEALRERVASYRAERGFREALASARHPALIAELKRKSPSRGVLRERFDPVSLAQTLEAAGAAALSVLTDEPFFGGHPEFLRDAKQFTAIPALRKEFILEPYQVYESALYLADAVLLIARLLPTPQLQACAAAARALGIEPFIEVHAEAEVAAAVSAGARVIGINHRDLATFRMDPELSARLIPRIPAGALIVAESGIQSAADVERMRRLGVHALLVGEALMTAPDPAAKAAELLA